MGGRSTRRVVVEKFVPSLKSLSSLGIKRRILECPGNFARMSRTFEVFRTLKTLTSLNKESRSCAILALGVFPLFLPLAIAAFGGREGYLNLAIKAFGAFEFIVPKCYDRLENMEIEESKLLIQGGDGPQGKFMQKKVCAHFSFSTKVCKQNVVFVVWPLRKSIFNAPEGNSPRKAMSRQHGALENTIFKLFAAENGPFGASFFTPTIPLKNVCVGPFLRSFPGNEAHQLFSGGPKWGVLGGGPKSCVEKVYVLFRSPRLGQGRQKCHRTGRVGRKQSGTKKQPKERVLGPDIPRTSSGHSCGRPRSKSSGRPSNPWKNRNSEKNKGGWKTQGRGKHTIKPQPKNGFGHPHLCSYDTISPPRCRQSTSLISSASLENEAFPGKSGSLIRSYPKDPSVLKIVRRLNSLRETNSVRK